VTRSAVEEGAVQYGGALAATAALPLLLNRTVSYLSSLARI